MLTKFGVKFGDLQVLLKDIQSLINGMDEETAKKCKSAVKSVMGVYAV